MEAKAKLLGHPIHQMLIVFPLGLLATSLFFDIAYLITNRGELARVAYWMIFAGVISALVAAVFGLVDWLGIPSGTRAKAIGAWHGSGNVIVAALFAVSWWVRRGDPSTPATLAIAVGRCGLHRARHRLARRRARRSALHRRERRSESRRAELAHRATLMAANP